jgi:hypothetical protein
MRNAALWAADCCRVETPPTAIHYCSAMPEIKIANEGVLHHVFIGIYFLFSVLFVCSESNFERFFAADIMQS